MRSRTALERQVEEPSDGTLDTAKVESPSNDRDIRTSGSDYKEIDLAHERGCWERIRRSPPRYLGLVSHSSDATCLYADDVKLSQ